MNKMYREALVVGLLTVAALSLVALAYSVTKLPEQAFLKRMRLPQMDFTQISTFEDTVALLTLKEEAFLSQEVTLTSVQGELLYSPRELGADPEGEELFDYLLDFMETSPASEKLAIYFFGKTLKFPIKIDLATLQSSFLDTGIEQGVKDAQFVYTNGAVQVDPEQIGYGIEFGILSALLKDSWESSFELPKTMELPLRSRLPELRTTTLEALLPEARLEADRTFKLVDEYSDSWDFSMAEHISLLLPTDEDSSEEQTFILDEEAFITSIELEFVPEVEEDPLPVTIFENEDGSYTFEGSARFGREIDKNALLASIEAALALPSSVEADTISLPIVLVAPPVEAPDSLKEKGVTDLLGYGYSSFKNSPSNRIHNISRGMEQFNGVLIEQGEEFSFTALMGAIDAANGWLPELVIKGDETLPEYGGGLCQVSSTMFRAILYTGLPITARKYHSYAVSYYAVPYGYGLDATVYDPLPDLRFMNDTTGAILIQGYTEGTDAYFVFYGSNDGRTVSMDGPYSYDYEKIETDEITYTDELPPGVRELEEYAHTGFKVDWYRTVTYPDGSLSSENIHSAYQARPAKYLEGKAEEEEEEVGG